MRVAGFDGFARRCTLWVYCGENFLGVARISESSDGNVRVVGVGKVGRAVGKNAAHHFGDQVDAFDVVPAFERNALQHVQRFDNSDTTGAGRRRGEDFPGVAIVFVLRAQNLADFRLVLGQFVESNETAEPKHIVHQHVSSFATVEFSSAIPGDTLKCGRQLRLEEGISGMKHFALVQKNPAADGEALEGRAFLFEFVRKPLANGKALFGQANGRSYHIAELHRAVGFER